MGGVVGTRLGSRELRFGISRSHGGSRILDGARQFTEVLGEVLEAKVRLHVAFDYNDLLRAFLAGTIDVAWLSPLVLVQALMKAALLAACCERDGRLTYRGALLVREDDPAVGMADLVGKRAVWVDPSSASGHVFPRLHLVRGGGTPGSETFTGSWAQACTAVARGEADVCAAYLHVAVDAAAATAEVHALLGAHARGLRVLDVTEPIPTDGIAIGSQLSIDEHLRVATALHGLHVLGEGQAALRTLLQATRLVPPTEEVQRAVAGLVSVLTSVTPPL